mgnify:CR=1 FL=1
MKKRLLTLVLLSCVAFSLAAGGAQEEAADDAAPDKEVVVGMENIMFQLDPTQTSNLNASMVFENMFDSLFHMNEVTLEIEPWVCTDYTVSDDGLTWTMNLREDVMFWDGEQLTAEDVKFTLDRMRDPKMGFTGNTNYLNSMMNVDYVTVEDTYTVSVTTEVPVPALPYLLEECYLVPQHYYEGLTSEEVATLPPMASGPFKFVDFEKDSMIVMEANNEYWAGAPDIQKITWRVIPEASTRVAELQSGGVELIQSVPAARYETVRNLPNATLKPVVSGCRQVLWPNHNDPRFEDKRVRQALNYGVDWGLVSDAFYKGTVPRMVINVNPPWLNEDLEPYPYDPDKAKSLMEEAGWSLNSDGIYEKDGVVMDFDVMTYYEATSERVEILTAILGMLEEIGIKGHANPTERSVAIAKMDAHDFGPMLFMASCSSFEGEGDIHDLYGSSVTNYGEYKNAEFDAILDELGQTFDPEKRAELLDDAQEIAYEDAAQVWLFNLPFAYGVADRLDYNPMNSGRIHLYFASINE